MEKETLAKTRKEGALKKTEKYKRIYKIQRKILLKTTCTQV